MTAQPTLDPAQFALAIHTSSPELGLAIDNFAGDRRSQTWAIGHALSTHIHAHLSAFLPPQTWQDLAFIVVARGPGSFTGTRIGVVVARTIAQQLDIPLFACSTLMAIAKQRSSACSGASDLAVQLPASRGEVFAAIYAPDLSPLLFDTVMPAAVWQEKLQMWQRPYTEIVAEGGFGDAASLLDLAYADWQRGNRPHWSAALPFYGQHPVEQ